MTETSTERRARLRYDYIMGKTLLKLAAGEGLSKQRIWSIITDEGRDRTWLNRVEQTARKRRIAFLRSLNQQRKLKP